MTTPSSDLAPGALLRALMDKDCIALPGAYDGMIARAVAQTGFQGCYVSGGAVSMTSGVPDLGIASLETFTRVIRTVADSSGLPLIADADTGFGEGEMVTRVIWEYSRAGAAGCHLEDQVFPKRCGHLAGKALVPVDHMVEKVARASKARDAIDGHGKRGSFIVCARTDARSVDGLDAAIDRAKSYVTDAGADMIFPEGLASEDEFKQFADALRGLGGGPAPDGGPYMLANMTEFGKTPIIPLARFKELGYHCVIYPYPTLRLAMKHALDLLLSLKEQGHVEPFIEHMQSRDDMYAMLEYTPGEEWEFPTPTRPA